MSTTTALLNEFETILSQIADLARSHGLTADRIQVREHVVYLDTVGFDRGEFKTLARIANEIVTTIALRFPARTSRYTRPESRRTTTRSVGRTRLMYSSRRPVTPRRTSRSHGS